MTVKLEVVSLRKHPTLSEKWVQDHIAGDSSNLGIGELELKDKESMQAGAGRLDLLLYDPDTLKRCHIIRTIEYCEIERKRYPQCEHTAVLVAEHANGCAG